MTGDFRVGHWLVAPSLNTVSLNGTSLRVEPKVTEVLLCLAQHAGGSQALIHEVAPTMDEIAKTRYFPRDLIIDAHRYAGDRNGALAWLEVAQKEQDDLAMHLRSDRRWAPYRSDLRFQSAVSRAGLAP